MDDRGIHVRVCFRSNASVNRFEASSAIAGEARVTKKKLFNWISKGNMERDDII